MPCGSSYCHAGATSISAYEVIGHEVILYWCALKADEKRINSISRIQLVLALIRGQQAPRIFIMPVGVIPKHFSLSRAKSALNSPASINQPSINRNASNLNPILATMQCQNA